MGTAPDTRSAGALELVEVRLPRVIAERVTEFLEQQHSGKLTLEVSEGRVTALCVVQTIKGRP